VVEVEDEATREVDVVGADAGTVVVASEVEGTVVVEVEVKSAVADAVKGAGECGS
jgi:hypothetical protein